VNKRLEKTMRPAEFDADPDSRQSPTLDAPVSAPGAAVHAAPEDPDLNEEDEKHTLEEPGYGHGV
jgi:hypothetical protein